MTTRTVTKNDDPGMVEVRREDQMNINKFSACNRKMQELSSEEAVLKQDLQNLQDATDELLLADDDELIKCVPRDAVAPIPTVPPSPPPPGGGPARCPRKRLPLPPSARHQYHQRRPTFVRRLRSHAAFGLLAASRWASAMS